MRGNSRVSVFVCMSVYLRVGVSARSRVGVSEVFLLFHLVDCSV